MCRLTAYLGAPAPVEALVFGLLAGAVNLASGAGGEFIYFQF